jgi:hypothetical protein
MQKTKPRKGPRKPPNNRPKRRPKQKSSGGGAVNSAINQLAKLSISGSKYTNPLDFRKLPMSRLLSEMSSYQKHLRDRYLIGLIHPDLAVQHGLSPKLFNDIPLPTTTIGLYGSFTRKTNVLGNALVTFRPPGQPAGDSPASMCFVTFNNDPGLDGVTNSPHNQFVPTIQNVTVPLQRYRLVSCLFKLTYEGPLLNQSGKFYSNACYDNYGIIYKTSAITATDNFAARYGDFQLIKNGLWNNVAEVTSTSHAMECLWVPTDVMDYSFQRAFSYYGTNFVGLDVGMGASTEGAHLCFNIAAQGLPPETNLTVENWVNYEVIADPSAAPYMVHTADTAWSAGDLDKYHKVISDTVKGDGLIREPMKKGSSSWSSVISSIISEGAPVLKTLLSAF